MTLAHVNNLKFENSSQFIGHFLVALLLFLAACNRNPGGEPATEPSETAAVAADRGSTAFVRCRSCHTLDANGKHLVGPNLHGIIGARAGSKASYNYSAALRQSGIVWDRDNLDKWIENPTALVPGHKMAFAGIARSEQRAAIIDYLAEQAGRVEGRNNTGPAVLAAALAKSSGLKRRGPDVGLSKPRKDSIASINFL